MLIQNKGALMQYKTIANSQRNQLLIRFTALKHNKAYAKDYRKQYNKLAPEYSYYKARQLANGLPANGQRTRSNAKTARRHGRT